jgi:hypothetical protein
VCHERPCEIAACQRTIHPTAQISISLPHSAPMTFSGARSANAPMSPGGFGLSTHKPVIIAYTSILSLRTEENRHQHTSTKIAQYYLNGFRHEWRSIPRDLRPEGLRPKNGILRSFEFEGAFDQRGFSRNRSFNFCCIGAIKQDVICLDVYATYQLTKWLGTTESHIPACIISSACITFKASTTQAMIGLTM